MSVCEEVDEARGRTLQFFDRLVPREFVAEDDFGRVETHGEEVFCLLEEFTREHHDEVCAISHLDGARAGVSGEELRQGGCILRVLAVARP